MLGEANAVLIKTRDDLLEEKEEAVVKSEELKTQVKAQDDIALKRLQNKLQRDKTQEAKELLAQEEIIIAANDDLESKLREERNKFDMLLSGRQDIEEKLKRTGEKMAEDKVVLSEQDAKTAELKQRIDEEQKLFDDMNQELTRQKKIALREEERARDLA